MADAKEKFWSQMLEAPRAFAHGLFGGLIGPLVALGGAVGLLYALTRQLPAIKPVTRSDGQQGTAIVLASPTEARASWVRYGGELRGAMLEVKARRRAQ
jgi:hypothetical protein